MFDDPDDIFDDDDLEDFREEPVPTPWKYLDQAAQRIVRPEWIGHPPWKVPPLPKAHLKELADICLRLNEQSDQEARQLASWIFSRLAHEAEAHGKLKPVGGRIYGLIMLLIVLHDAGVEAFASVRVEGSSNSQRSEYTGPPTLCQATGVDPAQCTLPTDDPNRPYILSHTAADRLEHRCLSPIEWYRLVARHGLLYHLLEDFYQDDGEPLQPMFPASRSRAERVPRFEDVRDDMAQLLDFVIFNLQLDRKFENKADVMAALGSFDRSAVEAELAIRSGPLPGRIAQVCWDIRVALGHIDERQIRHRWGQAALNAGARGNDIASLARDSVPIIGSAATIDLLIETADRQARWISPFTLAFNLRDAMGSDMLLELVLVLMDRVPADRFASEVLHALSEFRDQGVLDWIEQHARDPIGYEWGTAAAVNGMSWERAEKWLKLGRPLSLVALDAMKNCRGFDKEDGQMSGVFRDYSPRIGGQPRAAEVREVLSAYAKQDPDKRMTDAVALILAHVEKIF